MASLIRSANIAAQHRLLDSGRTPDSKTGELPDKPVEQKQVSKESVKKWEADLHASSLARSELESELRNTQERVAQTEKELQRLLTDIDELRRDATEAGRESGYRSGIEEARTELAQQGERLQELIKKITIAHEDSLSLAEEDIVEVVFASVTKILGEALVKPDTVIAAVKQSIRRLVSRDRLVIHLAPKDKRLIEDVVAGKEEEIFGIAVEIIADERIELGGCLLQTSTGGLDARLELQIQQLRDCLVDVAVRQDAER
ncbi:MAG: FliH/SctL family protein [Candidatus Thiodiazotropha sp. 6PLUC2]